MSLSVLDDRVQTALIADGLGRCLKTLSRLAARADADGVVSVPLEWVQEGTGLRKRQQMKHYRDLENAGYMQRIDGGYRGKTLVIVIKRFVNDGTAFVAHQARRAIYAARRKRLEAIRAFKAKARTASLIGRRGATDPEQVGSLMGALKRTPLTSLEGEQAANSAALPTQHAFKQGDLLGWCSECALPEANARHRRGKSSNAWSNTRTTTA